MTERRRGCNEGTEGEIVGWHHRLNGHETEQTPGDSEGQGRLACCSPWGHRQLDMTWQLSNNSLFKGLISKYSNNGVRALTYKF